MKTKAIVIAIIAVSIIIPGYIFISHKTSAQNIQTVQTGKQSVSKAPINTSDNNNQSIETVKIEELAAKPLEHPGILRVDGVVGLSDGTRSLFILVSPEEYAKCGTICISDLTTAIPVKWTTVPKVGEKVLVEGKLQKEDDGLWFVAQKVQKHE